MSVSCTISKIIGYFPKIKQVTLSELIFFLCILSCML